MGCSGSSNKTPSNPSKRSYCDGKDLGGGKFEKYTEVPEELCKDQDPNAEPIKEIDLKRNQISSIPESFFKAHSDMLQILDLSNNSLAEFPKPVCKMTALKQLKLSGNNFDSVPKDIKKLSNLTLLGLGALGLKKVPKEVGEMAKLEQLLLNNNQLKELPESICDLKTLLSLQVMVNPDLAQLPENIGKLELMTNLNANNCSLTSLPESIGDCKALIKLEVNDNKLTSMPDSCQKLLEHNCVIKIRPQGPPDIDIEFYAKYEPAAVKIIQAREARGDSGADAAAPAAAEDEEVELDEHGLPKKKESGGDKEVELDEHGLPKK